MLLRRTLSLLLLSTMSFLLLGGKPVNAGVNDDMVFNPQWSSSGHHTADPVDYLTWCGDCVNQDYHNGTPWVVNPHDNWPYGLGTFGEFEPGCMWDSDDEYSWISTGNILQAHTSAIVQECRYSDLAGYPRLKVDVGISSSSNALIVTQKWDWGTGSVTHTFPAVFNTSDHKWHYFDCIESPDPIGASLVTIPNSNGGQAATMLITITVTNPTSQKINKTGGFVEGGLINGLSRGCQIWNNP